jgi:pyruvate dehydrogenase E2 component (dihydrolipoamide acetyltransferase)
MTEKKLPLINASPKTRKFARELGANLYLIKGSQREGRVSEEDIKLFVKNSLSGAAIKKNEHKNQTFNYSDFGKIEEKPIPRIKKIAGPHLQKSWNEIPHVTQHDEADITEMETFRKSLRDLYTGEKISVTPLAFIIRAVVKALKDYPNFNSSLDLENKKIIYKKYFHIGIAVDTPHGLMVPKIRDADKKDIRGLGKELKRVSKLSAELKIDKKEFFGGSMTISSLGSIGGSFFTPIINQPEVAILGIGRSVRKQVFTGEKYESRIMLPLSLSYDHRIIDGVEGAKFCVHLKESLGKDFAYKLAV